MSVSENESIKYRDDADKIYGVVGMTLGLLVANAEQYILDISDGRNGKSVRLLPSFYVSAGSGISAKTIWEEDIKRFRTMTSMAIGNLLCRVMVNQNVAVTPELLRKLHDSISEVAEDCCQLQKDETDGIFNEYLRHFSRLFRMEQVRDISRNMADSLKERHTLTRSEIFEMFSEL